MKTLKNKIIEILEKEKCKCMFCSGNTDERADQILREFNEIVEDLKRGVHRGEIYVGLKEIRERIKK